MGYQMTEAELDKLAAAFHEAGHAIGAVVLGGRVDQVHVDDQPRTEYDSLTAGTRAAVSFAGPWAEARWTLGRRPGASDIRRVLTRNSADEKSICASVHGMAEGDHVAGLMERCYPAVKNLAKTLYFTGKASHADVCVALGLTDHGGPGSLGLALIRSGSSPGALAVTQPAPARIY